jgi:hypothetical protein
MKDLQSDQIFAFLGLTCRMLDGGNGRHSFQCRRPPMNLLLAVSFIPQTFFTSPPNTHFHVQQLLIHSSCTKQILHFRTVFHFSSNLSTPHLSFTSPAAFHFPAIFHFRILLPLPNSSYTSAPTFRLPVYFFHFPSHHSLPLSPLTFQPILHPPPPPRDLRRPLPVVITPTFSTS